MLQRIKNYYHLLQALLAINFYRYPAKKLFVIGVTGTDGKTTTTSLIYHILKTAGKNVAMISTFGAYIGNETFDTGFHTTTPSSFFLQKYIKKAGTQHEYLVLEVTSHALDQNRVYGIPFEIAVLTNITHEHLDYHKTYEKYAAAKLKLLRLAKVAIVNRNDQSYDSIKYQVVSSKDKKKVITYGLSKDTDVNPKLFPFETKLLGDFNKHNILAAIAVARDIGIDDGTIRNAVASFIPPSGRQEVIFDKDFRVIIDFAHTPNAFEKILPVVKETTKGRLIHVFGVAGKRDSSKRPVMGKAASEFADVIVLTAEDPRGESIEKINKEIREGISKDKFLIRHSNFPRISPEEILDAPAQRDYQDDALRNKKYSIEIPDRKEAITFAIGLAEEGDTVILTGKAHEKSMNLTGHTEVSWDEFAVAKEAIEKKTRNN